MVRFELALTFGSHGVFHILHLGANYRYNPSSLQPVGWCYFSFTSAPQSLLLTFAFSLQPRICILRKTRPELVGSYIDYLSPRIGCQVSGITNEALEAMCHYSWPGNVRELINVIERAMLLCEGDVITSDDLPRSITDARPLPAKPMHRDTISLPEALLEKPLKEARQDILGQFERSYLTSLLRAAKGRVGEAAKQAGISARTLFDKMEHHGLTKEDFRPQRGKR